MKKNSLALFLCLLFLSCQQTIFFEDILLVNNIYCNNDGIPLQGNKKIVFSKSSTPKSYWNWEERFFCNGIPIGKYRTYVSNRYTSVGNTKSTTLRTDSIVKRISIDYDSLLYKGTEVSYKIITSKCIANDTNYYKIISEIKDSIIKDTKNSRISINTGLGEFNLDIIDYYK